MRSLVELTEVDDPAWPVLEELFGGGAAEVEVCPADPARGPVGLEQLQVTTRSFLGAVVAHSGGLLLDGGWLRIYGGPGGLPSLAEVNAFPAAVDPDWRPADGLVVAHDLLGGVFALNGMEPERPGAPGEIVYFAPDSLEWEALGAGYAAWLEWLLSGALDQFYESLRWPGWREETAGLAAHQGVAVYPFLWTEQAREDLAGTTRKPVPMAELLGIAGDFCAQLGVADPGFLGRVGQ
ncbi:DUF2625 family protein [Kitasatospora sp. NPDC056181]|uniref:DUF2625 family protein n=1 Tax=Kitasatospora sp. NPDC056181 TaxID=3345737 RepID=UPI0035DA437E